jgi:hypothetical protein
MRLYAILLLIALIVAYVMLREKRRGSEAAKARVKRQAGGDRRTPPPEHVDPFAGVRGKGEQAEKARLPAPPEPLQRRSRARKSRFSGAREQDNAALAAFWIGSLFSGKIQTTGFAGGY